MQEINTRTQSVRVHVFTEIHFEAALASWQGHALQNQSFGGGVEKICCDLSDSSQDGHNYRNICKA